MISPSTSQVDHIALELGYYRTMNTLPVVNTRINEHTFAESSGIMIVGLSPKNSPNKSAIMFLSHKNLSQEDKISSIKMIKEASSAVKTQLSGK